MTFSINRSFKVIPFTWGDYDGERFREGGFTQTRLPYLWSRFWYVFTVYDILRYLTLFILPRNQHALEFYLGDYASALSGNAYRLMVLIGPIYNLWLLLVMHHFQRMMGPDARYRYWLRYFRIPATRSPSDMPLAGYSKRKLEKFWQFSSALQCLVTRCLFVQAFLVMTIFASSYLVMMQKYRHEFSVLGFWTILIANFVSLQAIGTINLLATHCPVIYLFLNCKILEERIARTSRKLQQSFVRSKFNSSKMKQFLHDLGTIIDELQRCNVFWSPYLAFNYFIAIFSCSVFFLWSLNSDDFIIISNSVLCFALTYLVALAACFYVCGKLHSTIKSTYRPLTNLMTKKELKLGTSLKIERLLNFIQSEFAGFRCASLFLIRKDVSMEVFFSIIVNTILLHNMVYSLFYIPQS